MAAVYKKELKSYLTSMIGYIFIFFIMIMTGIYFTAYNLQSAYPVFGLTLSAVTFIFMIAVPILTMKVMAEEKRAKTDQLLLTSPVPVSGIIIGKFLALATVYMIPMVIICFYPLIMLQFGTVSLPMAYTAIFGFILMGFAYIAVGMFMSSLTESQVIAAVLSFVVLFACYMSNGIGSFFGTGAMASLITFAVLILILAYLIYYMIKNFFVSLAIALIGEIVLIAAYLVNSSMFAGAIQDFLNIFNISDHLDSFVDGIFDITGVVYFLSIVVIFLYLSMQTMLKRRWS